jgi:hypothetical protein
MFAHLPAVTKDNLDSLTAKEIPYFQHQLSRCIAETCKPDDTKDCLCCELIRTNPFLAKAVRATAHAVASQLEGHIEAGLEWEAAISAIPGILACLRLLDRALEAQKLEAEITSSKKDRGQV